MLEMINDNQEPTQMDYDLRGSKLSYVRSWQNFKPQPQQEKKGKARGPAFTTFDDILLVKA